jgi:hypothetical protein
VSVNIPITLKAITSVYFRHAWGTRFGQPPRSPVTLVAVVALLVVLVWVILHVSGRLR